MCLLCVLRVGTTKTTYLRWKPNNAVPIVIQGRVLRMKEKFYGLVVISFLALLVSGTLTTVAGLLLCSLLVVIAHATLRPRSLKSKFGRAKTDFSLAFGGDKGVRYKVPLKLKKMIKNLLS